jgi:ribosomal protein S18 acetylase RimI-like enzyme
MGLQVRAVDGVLGRSRFVDLPFRLFRSNPEWTPPLRQSVRDRISPRHPSTEHQRARLWMAYRDTRPVGRVAACVDDMFNEFHGAAWAWVGFFECADEPAAAGALFDAAWTWAGEQGMDTCIGPASFTTNDEIGLLVEGHEHPPTFLTPHGPAYYEKLFTGAGWQPTKDLWGWRFGPEIPRLSERQQAVLARLARRDSFRVRGARLRDFDAEVHRFFEVYNAAWSRNWGFAPMTRAEVSHLAKDLKLIADEDLALFVENDSGETVAAALAVPDVNQAIAHLRSGRLAPLGWLRLLAAQRRIDSARILLLGVRPEYETRALGPLLYSAFIERLAAKPGMRTVEASWTLATNDKVNKAIAAIGATHHKTWRLYERTL